MTLVVRKALTGDRHAVIKIPKKVAVAGSRRRNDILIVTAFRTQKNAQVVIEQVPFDRLSVVSGDQVHKGLSIDRCNCSSHITIGAL